MRPALAADPRAFREREEQDALRIAVYCPHYEDAGGVREVVRRLTAGMAIRGHEVDVIARLPGGNGAPLPARDPSTGVPILRMRVVCKFSLSMCHGLAGVLVENVPSAS